MASILDVLFSIVLGGLLTISIVEANDVAMENTALLLGDQMVQEAAVDVSMYLDGEMRNMGFGVPDSMKIVMRADSNFVTYRVSLPPFGKVDTVSFYLGATTDLSATPNAADRYVYRRENNGPAIAVGVVTYLRFRYYDRSDSMMSFPVSNRNLGQILKVEVTTEVQNSYAQYRDRNQVAAGQQDALYSSFLWSQTRLAAQNVRFAPRPAQHPRPTRPPGSSTPTGPVTPPPKKVPPPVTAKPAPAPAPAPRPIHPPPPPPPPPPPVLGMN